MNRTMLRDRITIEMNCVWVFGQYVQRPADFPISLWYEFWEGRK